MPIYNKRENLHVESLHHCLGTRSGTGSGISLSTQHEAQRLGLTGYAKNMDDGSVEIVACGESQQVEQLMKWLKAGGPRSARVDRVLSEPHRPGDELKGFSIRY